MKFELRNHRVLVEVISQIPGCYFHFILLTAWELGLEIIELRHKSKETLICLVYWHLYTAQHFSFYKVMEEDFRIPGSEKILVTLKGVIAAGEI